MMNIVVLAADCLDVNPGEAYLLARVSDAGV